MKDNDLLFNVKIGEFDGPLDVLDNIIREHRLDILDLDIAKLAEQYLIFIQTNIKTVSIDVASEYLAMATYLLELKSKKIIPVDSDVSDNSNFEYQRNKLIKQIMEFKKYRDVVTVLIKKQNTRMQMLAKPADDLENYVTNKTIEAMPKSVDPNKLAHALQIAFEK
jgi:segregation and condensation protein A